MKRNGFVSTALIYTFFIIFLTLMVYLLSSYANKRILLNSYKEDIKKSFINENIDVTLFYMVWNNETLTYEINNTMPTLGYIYNGDLSNCNNGSIINYLDGNFTIDNTKEDMCFLYFDLADKELNNASVE